MDNARFEALRARVYEPTTLEALEALMGECLKCAWDDCREAHVMADLIMLRLINPTNSLIIGRIASMYMTGIKDCWGYAHG